MFSCRFAVYRRLVFNHIQSPFQSTLATPNQSRSLFSCLYSVWPYCELKIWTSHVNMLITKRPPANAHTHVIYLHLLRHSANNRFSTIGSDFSHGISLRTYGDRLQDHICFACWEGPYMNQPGFEEVHRPWPHSDLIRAYMNQPGFQGGRRPWPLYGVIWARAASSRTQL